MTKYAKLTAEKNSHNTLYSVFYSHDSTRGKFLLISDIDKDLSNLIAAAPDTAAERDLLILHNQRLHDELQRVKKYACNSHAEHDALAAALDAANLHIAELTEKLAGADRVAARFMDQLDKLVNVLNVILTDTTDSGFIRTISRSAIASVESDHA